MRNISNFLVYWQGLCSPGSCPGLLVSSIGSRMNELERKRWYPFQDIMDKDNEKYVEQGHTLVDLREEFYDNCTT